MNMFIMARTPSYKVISIFGYLRLYFGEPALTTVFCEGGLVLA